MPGSPPPPFPFRDRLVPRAIPRIRIAALWPPRPFWLLFSAALLALAGCNKLSGGCDEFPYLEARDTTVATQDTVRILVRTHESCGEGLRYLWSLNGGTYDTTKTTTFAHLFTRADIGTRKLRIRVLAGNGRMSYPVLITLTVVEKLLPYRLPKDTLDYFADTSVAVDLTPADTLPGIEWYYLTKPSYPSRIDSSRSPVFRIAMPRGFESQERFIAQVQLASGIRSETTSVVLRGRPRPFGSNGIAAAMLGTGSVRLIQSVRTETAPVSPRSGERIMNTRVMEMDFDGKILRDGITPSARDIRVQQVYVQPDGSSLILGRDMLGDEQDPYLAAYDRSGAALWETTLDLDSNSYYTQAIRTFPGTGGNALLITTNDVSIRAGDGKPPSKYAVRIHFVTLGPDGKVVSDRPVNVPDMHSQPVLAERMRDGSIAIAGMLEDTAAYDRQCLLLLDFDVSGKLAWSKSFCSEAGTSVPRSLDVLADGSIYLTGEDYGPGSPAQISGWILKLDEKGNRIDFRVPVPPKGYSGSGLVRNHKDLVLRFLTGDAGVMLLATDLNGNERWRRAIAKSFRSAYLYSGTALPDGSFLVFGSVSGDYATGWRSDNFGFRISAEGEFLW